MATCLECGNDLRDRARFCDKCGFPVRDEGDEGPSFRPSSPLVIANGSSDQEGNGKLGRESDLLENPDLPPLVDYRVIGFLLVGGCSCSGSVLPPDASS
jgi:zinc-ribbon domain